MAPVTRLAASRVSDWDSTSLRKFLFTDLEEGAPQHSGAGDSKHEPSGTTRPSFVYYLSFLNRSLMHPESTATTSAEDSSQTFPAVVVVCALVILSVLVVYKILYHTGVYVVWVWCKTLCTTPTELEDWEIDWDSESGAKGGRLL